MPKSYLSCSCGLLMTLLLVKSVSLGDAYTKKQTMRITSTHFWNSTCYRYDDAEYCNPTDGRLETNASSSGAWGAVCADNFTSADATRVCGDLLGDMSEGNTATATTTPRRTWPTGLPLYTLCRGGACAFEYVEVTTCVTDREVILNCPNGGGSASWGGSSKYATFSFSKTCATQFADDTPTIYSPITSANECEEYSRSSESFEFFFKTIDDPLAPPYCVRGPSDILENPTQGTVYFNTAFNYSQTIRERCAEGWSCVCTSGGDDVNTDIGVGVGVGVGVAVCIVCIIVFIKCKKHKKRRVTSDNNDRVATTGDDVDVDEHDGEEDDDDDVAVIQRATTSRDDHGVETTNNAAQMKLEVKNELMQLDDSTNTEAINDLPPPSYAESFSLSHQALSL